MKNWTFLLQLRDFCFRLGMSYISVLRNKHTMHWRSIQFNEFDLRGNTKSIRQRYYQVSSWSYETWIYSYLCNQRLYPLVLWVWILFMAMCSIQLDVIKFISNLRQVFDFFLCIPDSSTHDSVVTYWLCFHICTGVLWSH